jgi:protein-arginine kinase activator protein McsA
MGRKMLNCTRCKTAKPATLEFFPPHNKKKSGFDSWCRNCRSSYRNGIHRGLYRNMISDNNLIKVKKICDGKCNICGKTAKLAVDHDHKTNKFRGLLCDNCNMGLGQFKDDPMLLEFAQIYLMLSNGDIQAEEYLAFHGKSEGLS